MSERGNIQSVLLISHHKWLILLHDVAAFEKMSLMRLGLSGQITSVCKGRVLTSGCSFVSITKAGKGGLLLCLKYCFFHSCMLWHCSIPVSIVIFGTQLSWHSVNWSHVFLIYVYVVLHFIRAVTFKLWPKNLGPAIFYTLETETANDVFCIILTIPLVQGCQKKNTVWLYEDEV